MDTKESKESKIDIVPKAFKLQWHITERCNFRCKHCYQDNYDTSEMSLGQMENVLRQFVELVKKWKIPRFRASLSLSGGEPLLFKNLFAFLSKAYKYVSFYRCDIMSNGSLITSENAKILKSFEVEGVQVSLEGLEENNDKIRGEGNFKKAIEGIKILVEEGIHTVVSLTMTRENIKDIMPLSEFLTRLGVKMFRVRRLVPWGQGSQLVNAFLEPKELLRIYRRIEQKNERLFREGSCLRMPLACENSFLGKNFREEGYCGVLTGRILALLPSGDIYPCRRLPIKVGNILEDSFEEIYYSDKMREIRDIEKAPDYCRENCPKFDNCLGGAKCIIYAYGGQLDIPDVQCPIVYSKLGKKSLMATLGGLRQSLIKKLNSDDF